SRSAAPVRVAPERASRPLVTQVTASPRSAISHAARAPAPSLPMTSTSVVNTVGLPAGEDWASAVAPRYQSYHYSSEPPPPGPVVSRRPSGLVHSPAVSQATAGAPGRELTYKWPTWAQIPGRPEAS